MSAHAKAAVRSREERNQLYTQNEGLIWHILNQKLPPGFVHHSLYEEVVQELRITLMRCLELWKPEDGAVSTYCCVALSRRVDTALIALQRRRGLQLTIDVAEEPKDDPSPGDPWDYLYELIGTLSPKEQDIIRRRFGLRCQKVKVNDIAAEYGVTRQRIAQIEQEALKKLGHRLRVSGLSPSCEASPGSSPHSFELPSRRSRRPA
jgi:RNA polymerase sigma factor (sigma-70 family)